MSSYRGAWDGGPPGAEAEYSAPAYTAPPAAPAMPTTDPWTGVSYSQYGSVPAYDYQAYGAASYPYNYDSSYYPPPPPPPGDYYGKYPEAGPYPPAQHAAYAPPPRPRERTRSPPPDARAYEPRRRTSRTKSRSVSPYEKDRVYSRKRDSSSEEESRRRKSRSVSSKHRKYSSSDRSSSRSYSRSSNKKNKKRKSVSSDTSVSDRSYHKSNNRGRVRTPPSRRRGSWGSRSRSRSGKTPSMTRSASGSPKKDSGKIKKPKSHSTKDNQRDGSTPPKKRKDTVTQKIHVKTERLSMTPSKTYKKSERSVTPPIKRKIKKEKVSPLRRDKESSLTPPKSYARRSTSSSKSSSKSPSPPRRVKTKRSRRSRSQSSDKSECSTPPRSKSKRDTKKKSEHRSRSKSRSKRRSWSKSRSTSRRRSKSRGKGKRSESPKPSKSRSRSRSSRSRSRSGSGTPSDDERRGQFTVADRKRFWKLHRNRQEEREKEDRGKTPPKEVLPPPGAVESTRVDDIEYGDPPEVEGPNFAELLPTADQVLQRASTSKVKPGGPLPIKNDGSFLEMFKKMQEETKKSETVEKKPEIKKPVLPFIGKRRGGRVLKTGLVKKAKAIDEQTADNTPKDAWSLYMQEVKKYRETSCEEERKTRPLVK